MKYKLSDKMLFGKHNGRTIGAILASHPEYINWCLNNVSDFEVDFDSDSKDKSTVCWKCGGSGYIPEYRHVERGICFSCNGKGYFDYSTDRFPVDEE